MPAIPSILNSHSRWAFIGMFCLFLAGCGQPQITKSDRTLKDLDALFTAVTTKRKDLLEDCRKRFTELKSEGEVSAAAFKVVVSIMDEAAQDRWSTAAPRLYDFIRAQRWRSKQ